MSAYVEQSQFAKDRQLIAGILRHLQSLHDWEMSFAYLMSEQLTNGKLLSSEQFETARRISERFFPSS